MPKTSYTASDIVGYIKELGERVGENEDEMGQLSERVEVLENAVGSGDGGGELVDRVSALEEAAGSGGDKEDIADRVEKIEEAAANAESEKDDLEGQIYALESAVARIVDRLAPSKR